MRPSAPGSEEGAEQAKEAMLKEVGKVTDVVSSLGFSWWQGGPPHTQSLKDLHWVSTVAHAARRVFAAGFKRDMVQKRKKKISEWFPNEY